MSADRCDKYTLATVYSTGTELYDRIWSPVILPPSISLISRLDFNDAHCVLDVGAGTGALTEALRQAAPHGYLISIDPSWEMLRLAPVDESTSVAIGDAMALPLAGGCAQIVLLAYVLFHLSDPTVGVREAARVLRPGGQLGTVTWAQEWPSNAAKIWDQTLEEHEVATLPLAGNHHGLDSVEAVGRLLSASELHPIEIWTETVEHCFTPDSFWQMRTGYGLIRARLAVLDESVRSEVLADVERRLARLRPADFLFRGEVICSVSTRT